MYMFQNKKKLDFFLSERIISITDTRYNLAFPEINSSADVAITASTAQTIAKRHDIDTTHSSLE